MAKWLEQASQWHEMFCHDLEVMSSNPGRVKPGVRSTSKSYLNQKYLFRFEISACTGLFETVRLILFSSR